MILINRFIRLINIMIMNKYINTPIGKSNIMIVKYNLKVYFV